MNRKKAIIYLIITAFLWSIGGILVKSVRMNPIAIAGIRSGIAGLVMLFYLKKPSFHFHAANILGSICYACLLICFVFSTKLTTSANAIFLQFTSSIWVIIFSAVFLKQRPKKSDLITIVFVLLGMALFFISKLGAGSLTGNLIAALSGIFMAAMVLFLQGCIGNAVEVTFWGNILTFLVSIPFLPKEMPDSTSILCLLALGVIQLGIPYILYSLAVKHVSPVEGILIPVIEPLLNPVWVLIFSGETIGLSSLLGGCIIIAAVIINELYIEKRVKKAIIAT